MRGLTQLTILLALLTSHALYAQEWPSLDANLPKAGGGEKDAAVLVGITDYDHLPHIAGAAVNAKAWRDELVEVRGVPSRNVRLLRDGDATREDIESALQSAAQQVQAGGTLWFVFVGHGAPSSSGCWGLTRR